MENNSEFKSGFVSIIGRPNVGKSTIMNLLIGEKIAIMSHRPQTTRNKIRTILTTDDFQAVFIDTPGLHTPKSKLGDYMVKAAENALKEVDIILYVVEPYAEIKKSDMDIIERLKGIKTPVYLIINKIDTVEKPEILKVMDAYRKVYDFKEILPFSALKAVNGEELKEIIKNGLPEGPKYFPEDMITDQPERQLCSEIIREKALFLLDEEIPHGIAVEVTDMKKRDEGDITDIFANIYCEKNSHKGIIIGKQGAMLKKIGTKARADIERLLGSRVNLKLWVKVKKDWRDRESLLNEFGYNKKNI
ncbi:MAG: GTPase Era [Clostridiales bacterium]|nr:GTPase Era [Clostridiales bacterium]